jgi:hypothetical protein
MFEDCCGKEIEEEEEEDEVEAMARTMKRAL